MVRAHCLCLVLFLVVTYPAVPAAGFDYDSCVQSGMGSNHERMGAEAWRKGYSLTARKAGCARLDDQAKTEGMQRDEQERSEREGYRQEQSERARQKAWQCEQSGTCSSTKDIQNQIDRSKREGANPAALGRFSETKNRFVLLEEVKEPPAQRRPEVSLGTNSDGGSRYIRVTGVGLRPPSEVQLVCDGEVRRTSHTATSSDGDRTIASYEVSRASALVAMGSSSCDLALAGARLSIPKEKLSVVWGEPSSSTNAKRSERFDAWPILGWAGLRVATRSRPRPDAHPRDAELRWRAHDPDP